MRTSIAVAETNETNDHYRRNLIEKLNEVLDGLRCRFDTMASMGPIAEDDRPQVTHTEFLSLHRNRMDYTQLKLVEEALDRLDSGDYGICLECEQPIPPKRLRAVSWARYCVRCQEKLSGQTSRY